MTHAKPNSDVIAILVIDDDVAARESLAEELRSRGFDTTSSANGPPALEALAKEPDLVIAAAGLAHTAATGLLRRVRAMNPHTAVILIADGRDELGIVDALDLGAEDYVTKPVGMDEFVARVRTALRHRLPRPSVGKVYKTGQLAIDTARRKVTAGGRRVKMTPKEYELLLMLAENEGRPAGSATIMKRLWTEDTTQSYLRVLIRAMRKKIEPAAEDPVYILTVPGIGYRLRAPDFE